MKYAENFGYVIKLIGKVKRRSDGMIDIIVAPMLVPFKSQLANIDNEFNGIMVRGDCTGDVVFYGKGAGKLPTASAVVADIVDCCNHLKQRRFLYWADSKESNIVDYKESVWRMFARVTGEGAEQKAREVFGNINVNTKNGTNRIAFLTESMTYGDFLDKAAQLESKGVKVCSMIRIGEL